MCDSGPGLSCMSPHRRMNRSFLRVVRIIDVPLAKILLMLEYACDMVIVVVLRDGGCRYLCVLLLDMRLLGVFGVVLGWLGILGLVLWSLVGYGFVVVGCRLL